MSNAFNHADLFAQLRAQASQHHELKQTWFDPSLFQCQSPTINHYIDEVENNVARLHALSTKGEQYNWLMELVEQQLSTLVQALYRNRATHEAAIEPNATHRSALQQLYAQLTSYRGYEIRLADQLQLAQEAGDTPQQRERVITARQRLQRCQKAIQGVERRIAALEAKLQP